MKKREPIRQNRLPLILTFIGWHADSQIHTLHKRRSEFDMIMAFDNHDEQGRTLDSDQRIDARQMVGCGWAVRDVARHYGLTEQQLRQELGLPQFVREPDPDRQRSLFDDGGEI
jgi:hypothetical protein